MRLNEPRCVFTGLRLLHAQEFEGLAPEIDQRPPTTPAAEACQCCWEAVRFDRKETLIL